jgi:hypothetical protein
MKRRLLIALLIIATVLLAIGGWTAAALRLR